MGSNVENLRVEFMRILEEIEKVVNENGDSSYEPSKYESCIEINGKPILPPLMTPEKRQECWQWKKQAIKVEEKIAEKRKQKFDEAVEEQYLNQNALASNTTLPVTEQNKADKDLDEVKDDLEEVEVERDETITENLESISSEVENDVEQKTPEHNDENYKRRQRRLSYTLDEPSPVLLAYMQRFGQDLNSPQKDETEKVLEPENTVKNFQCVLEDYLAEISMAPTIAPKEVPDKLPKDSPGKENISPNSERQLTQEWKQKSDDLPSPLKNDAPTWARSPKIEKTREKEVKLARYDILKFFILETISKIPSTFLVNSLHHIRAMILPSNSQGNFVCFLFYHF